MKAKPKPKEVRAVRLSRSVWMAIRNAAYAQEMRPSEYIRRAIERALFADAQKKESA